MKKRATTFSDQEARLAFWLLLPAFTVVTALVVFPVVWNLWLSLKPATLGDLRDGSLFAFHWGLGNFEKVLTDPEFGSNALITLTYTVLGSSLSVLLGLIAALLVHGEFPGRSLLRGLFISPYVAPVVAVTFTWAFILDPQLGVLNWLATEKGVISAPIPFLSQRPFALISVILFEGWRYFPFAFLFILARLQAVPDELYQAAAVDGATPVQRFFHITLPQLATVLAMLFLFRFIWTINKFDDIFLLTRGQAGTKVLTIKLYDYAFGEFDIGAGSALAVVLFGMLAVFLMIYFWWTSRAAVADGRE